ncbi:MAG: 30S ribosomal protein S7 [Candidatus Shapirobacteria bacterium]
MEHAKKEGAVSRVSKVKKRRIEPDLIYQSRLVAKLINRSMKSGKKSAAQREVYQAMEIIKTKTGKEALAVFDQALESIKPGVEVRSRRVGGATYQVPTPVRGERRESLGIRWLIEAARARPNKEYHHFAEKLAAEILEALNNQGGAVKKKEDVHRMAEANRAFAHFRW